ncbi:plasmid mobilization protein [Succinatimonas hippei]|uniref:plasmid mobilization protein n=1 Tax=Succinatimonas hippei TaxID=626938 RepID=UPI0024918D9D|nr:hypothetical protein [Succinatimonas hippei]
MPKQKAERYQRKRPIVVAFRVSAQEFAALKERIFLSGKNKATYILESLLKQKIEITAGKFASDRLSLEVKRLAKALEIKDVKEDLRELLFECRELVGQLISLLKK